MSLFYIDEWAKGRFPFWEGDKIDQRAWSDLLPIPTDSSTALPLNILFYTGATFLLTGRNFPIPESSHHLQAIFCCIRARDANHRQHLLFLPSHILDDVN